MVASQQKIAGEFTKFSHNDYESLPPVYDRKQMFTAVMISKPNGLRQETVETAVRALKGRAVKWLCEAEAYEFETQSAVAPAELWEKLQKQGIDLAVVPSDNRRKKLLLADMDSTMIEQECIDELADLAGHGDACKSITARAMNGEIDFDSALRERVALFKDEPVEIIDEVIEKRISFMPGGKMLLSTMKHTGAYAALVSGGFTDFTAFVASELGFDEHRANQLLRADGKLTGEPGVPILGQAAKVQALTEITQRLGLRPDEVISVGDGANDLPMLKRSGMGVALHAKPAVQAEADIVLNHGDLSALLYLQGYSRTEFAAVDYP